MFEYSREASEVFVLFYKTNLNDSIFEIYRSVLLSHLKNLIKFFYF